MYFTDKPIKTGEEDKLGRNGFAELLAQALINLESTSTFTIGVYGKWGSGKTSLVNMALEIIYDKEKLKNDNEKMVIVRFNPWYFSDSEQLFFQFFRQLKTVFLSQKDKSKQEIGNLLSQYADSFSVLELIPKVGGIIAPIAKSGARRLGRQLSGNSGDVQGCKESIIKILQGQNTGQGADSFGRGRGKVWSSDGGAAGGAADLLCQQRGI